MQARDDVKKNLGKINNLYYGAAGAFIDAGYKHEYSVDQEYKAMVFKNPDNQIYILYYPGKDVGVENGSNPAIELETIIKSVDNVLVEKYCTEEQLKNANKIFITVEPDMHFGLSTNIYKTNQKKGMFVVEAISRIINNESPSEADPQINHSTIAKHKEYIRLGNAIKQSEIDIENTQSSNIIEIKKVGFFARHPWIKDVAIGVGIGLAIVGGVAAVVLTAGAALIPSILGFGAAVGFGTGGIAAIVATTFVAGCAAIAVGWGKVFDGQNQKQDIRNPRAEDGSWFNSTYVQIIKKARVNYLRDKFGIRNDIKSSEYQPKEGEIDKVIGFLQTNIEFFTAPFKNQKAFRKWFNENLQAQIFSDTFTYAMQRNTSGSGEASVREDRSPIFNFKNALLGESENLNIDSERIAERKKDLTAMLNDDSISKKEKTAIQIRLSMLEEQIQNIKVPRLTGLANGDTSLIREFLENNPKLVLFLSRRINDKDLLELINKWNLQNNATSEEPKIGQVTSKQVSMNSSDELPVLNLRPSVKQ